MDTMTTNINIRLVNDLSLANDTLYVDYDDEVIGAIVWLSMARESVYEAKCRCLEAALSCLREYTYDMDTWLLSAHSAVQADNRITRYRGFWNSIPKMNPKISDIFKSKENIVSQDGGIRAFGAILLENIHNIDIICNIYNLSQTCIISVDREISEYVTDNLLENGWNYPNSNPPNEIIRNIISKNGLIVSAYGEFDDIDVAVAIIGKPDMLKKIYDIVK